MTNPFNGAALVAQADIDTPIGALTALATLAALTVGGPAAHAAPPVILGYASNFDVTDTTDKPCHGFEIEIEDINDVSVVNTWGNWRYGRPNSIVNMPAFPSGHSGVRVKYQASYNGIAWSATTPIGAVDTSASP